MTPRVSVAIMACPSRLGNVRATVRSIGGRPRVIVDRCRAGAWPTARRAWLAYDKTATHHVVLQDDIQPCRHFREACTRLAEVRPRHCLALCVNRKKALDAREHGLSWIVTEGPWGQGIMLPVAWIRDFLTWTATWTPTCPHDDTRLTLFLWSMGELAWGPMPSLVEHLDNGSLIGNKLPFSRRATWFMGDADPLEIDWTRGLDAPARSVNMPGLKWFRDRNALEYWRKKRNDHGGRQHDTESDDGCSQSEAEG